MLSTRYTGELLTPVALQRHYLVDKGTSGEWQDAWILYCTSFPSLPYTACQTSEFTSCSGCVMLLSAACTSINVHVYPMYKICLLFQTRFALLGASPPALLVQGCAQLGPQPGAQVSHRSQWLINVPDYYSLKSILTLYIEMLQK